MLNNENSCLHTQIVENAETYSNKPVIMYGQKNGKLNNTYNKIVQSGKKTFLKNGYERSNLREICKGAGVTTGAFYRHFDSKEDLFGALVEPAIKGIYDIYDSSSEICFDYINSNNIQDLWAVSDETIKGFIIYIYQHFDSFKLLLQCSDGTKYVNFVNDLVAIEVQNSFKMFEVMKEHNIQVNQLSLNELNILNHSYLSCIFEAVMHDYSQEETLSYVGTIAKFFTAGWKAILGF